MHPVTPGVKLTYDDLLRLPDDDRRHELIDGEHYVTPSPNLRHQRISGNLHLLIGNWLASHPIGQIFYAPADIVLSPHDVVVPDLFYLSHARAADVITPERVCGVPDLLIEILSPGTRRRDETVKRALYERNGVLEYWMVDPVGEAVRVHRRTGHEFEVLPPCRCADEGVLTTPLLPGLEIAMRAVFAP
jgi:Uma2 family endonuclease